MNDGSPGLRFGGLRRSLRTGLFAAAWIGFTVASGAAWAQEPREPEPRALSEQAPDLTLIALTYGLEVREGDRWKRCEKQDLVNREFGAGDFFRLVITPLDDCHVYVINKSGDEPARVIFPSPGRELRLQPDSGERIVPGPDPVDQRQRYFEFRDPRGTEKLYVVATAEKVTQRESLTKVVVERLERKDSPDKVDKTRSESLNLAILRLGRDAARPPTGVAGRIDESGYGAKVYADDLRFKIRSEAP